MTITYLAPDGVEITAQQFRQAQAATHGGGSGRRLGGRSGFRVDTPSNVLTATSTTWTLGPCAAMIDPGATTHQGMYGWSSDANATGSVTAADATYARKDIVYIQVNDSSAGDGSGALNALVLYTAGVASASPVAPTLPARSFLVGTINVPVSGGGSPAVVLNPARFVAAGGILPVSSQTERDALVAYDGLTVQRMDLAGRPTETWNGTAWKAVPGALGEVFHSEATTNSGSIGSGFAVVSNAASFTFLAGRKYRIKWDMGYQISSANVPANVLIALCPTTDAAGSTTGLTQIQARTISAPVASQTAAFEFEAIYRPTADETRQVKWVANCPSASMIFVRAATNPDYFYIEDLGAQF